MRFVFASLQRDERERERSNGERNQPPQSKAPFCKKSFMYFGMNWKERFCTVQGEREFGLLKSVICERVLGKEVYSEGPPLLLLLPKYSLVMWVVGKDMKSGLFHQGILYVQRISRLSHGLSLCVTDIWTLSRSLSLSRCWLWQLGNFV